MKGAKAEGLEKLQQAGLRVPAFYAIPYAQFATLSGNFENDKTLIENILQPIPFSAQNYAVRSSSSVEDGQEKSFAGQFKTLLFVTPEQLPEAVFDVWKHFGDLDKTAYHSTENAPFGIVIQEMVTPDFAGVAFSVHPYDGDNDFPFVTVVPGVGEPLVSGKVTGCNLLFTPNGWTCEAPKETFEGEVNGTIVVISGKELLEKHRTILSELANTLKQLKTLLGVEVDTEFAIANGQLYWLQVRPITAREPKSVAIWDNTAAEINFPGTTLPLSLSFLQQSYALAYGQLAERIGIRLSEELKQQLQQMCGGIHGRFYYDVFAWQALISQLPFGKRVATQLPHFWGMDPVPQRNFPTTNRFKKTIILFRLLGLLFSAKRLRKRYKTSIQQQLEQRSSFTQKDEIALRSTFLQLERELADQWIAPTINGFFTALFLALFRKALKGTKLEHAHPNFVHDVLQSHSEVVTVRMVMDFHALLGTIQKDKTLLEFFRYEAPETIAKAVLAEEHSLNIQMNTYIRHYGCKAVSSELKLETQTFERQPEELIEQLQKSLDLPELTLSTTVDFKSEIRSYFPWYAPKRYWMTYLAKQSRMRVADRENFRFSRTQVFDLFREIALQLERIHLKKGNLEHFGDVFFLTRSELLAERSENWKQLVSERKTIYAQWEQETAVTRYRENTTGLHPVSSAIGDGDLKGTGCSSGLVSGHVCLLEDVSDSTDWENTILVASFFEPGDLSLFSKAKGIVSERGNVLSHTAILARELKIPAIVGVKGLLKTIRPGDHIEMNGSTGQIRRINEE